MIFDHTIQSGFFFAICSAFVLAILMKQFKWAFCIFMAALPLKHVFYNLGGHYLELWKTLSLITIPLTSFYVLHYASFYRPIAFFVLFFAYAMIMSIAAPLFFIQTTPHSFSLETVLAQGVQLASFLNLALLPIVLSQNDPKTLDRGISAYIYALVALCLLGLLQYGYYELTKINIFPIPRIQENFFQSDIGVDFLHGERIEPIFRMTSLSLEPRNFSLYLILGIALILERPAIISGTSKLTYSLIGALFGVCLLLTVSTSGYCMLAAYFLWRAVRLKRLPIGLILLLAAGAYFSGSGHGWFSIVQGQTYERLTDHGFLEDFDIAALRYFSDHWEMLITGVGFGNIHTVAVDYLRDCDSWAIGMKWYPKTGALYVITSVGLAGFTLLGFAFLYGYQTTRELRSHPLRRLISPIFLFFTALYLVLVSPMAFLLLGFVTACYFQERASIPLRARTSAEY